MQTKYVKYPHLDPIRNCQIYSGTYSTHEKGATIHLFGRTSKDERVLFHIDGFKPYFYRPSKRGKLNPHFNIKLEKVEVKYPNQVKKLRGDSSWEADIPFVRRFMIDADFEMEVVYPRIAYIDIETDRKGRLISMATAVNDEEILFDYEKENIMRRLELLEKVYDIDGFAGWNLPFDIGVLEQEFPYYFENKKRFVYFDIYEMFRTQWTGMQGEGLQDYTLNTVAKKLVGKGKYDTKGRYPDELDIDELREYNVRDVEILRDIDREMGLISLYTTIAWVNHSLIEDTFSYSVIGDIAMLREAKKRGIVLPSVRHDRPKESYEGAFVYANPGIYEDIHIWDLKSAYPTTVIKYNISPEIKLPAQRKREEKDGIVPSLMKKYLEKRKEYKKGTPANSAFKIMANSLYGLFGFTGSRIYDPQKAEFITKAVKNLLQRIVDHLLNRGFKVIYGDTDSLAISECDIDEVSKEIDWYLKKEDSTEYIFEYEDRFERGIVISKKQYAFRREDGSYKLRGLALRRGDTSEYLKEVYGAVLEKLIDGWSTEEIEELIREKFKAIQEEPLHKLTRNVSLNLSRKYKGIPQHLRAYNYSHDYLGYELKYGDKVRILPIKRVPNGYPQTDVIALPEKDLPDGFEVDYEEVKRQVLTRLSQILPHLSLKQDIDQRDLSSYFQM